MNKSINQSTFLKMKTKYIGLYDNIRPVIKALAGREKREGMKGDSRSKQKGGLI